jgi:2-dehydropantoate 2-reductase
VAELRVAILGAGSVGCFIGGGWAAAGIPVTLIGRERIAAEVAGHGLALSDYSGWRTRLDKPDFTTKPAALKQADLIALCVKSIATAAAAREIARHARKGALVVSFQNGVSNVDLLRAELGSRFEAVQGMVPFNVAHLGSGRFHKGVAGDLAAAAHPLTRRLSDAAGNGPARLRIEANMDRLAWGKLLINLNNAVNALSGRTLLDQLKERDYRRVVAASIIAALELLGAAGIEPATIGPVPPRLLPHVIASPSLVFNNLFLKIQKIDEKARSSMADDLQAGRPTEIDYLNGEVVKLAKRLGRKAPVNEAILSLVKQAELGIEHLWEPAQLRAHVLEGHRTAPIFGY